MQNTNQRITPNNGYLGSRIDEDRSEFRYLMRIAELVNHQTVERILHFFKREVSLFECVLTSLAALCCSSETAHYGVAAFEVYSCVISRKGENAGALKKIHVKQHTSVCICRRLPFRGVDQQPSTRCGLMVL